MEDRVLNLLAELLDIDVDRLKEEADTEGLWDSLKRAEIIFSLEEEFDIFFEQEDIVYMSTVNKIIETVEKK